MTDELRTIPISEVEQHSSAQSCWIIMDRKVYDVTTFLSEHPGGIEAITEFAGKDATASFEDVGHSKDAREMAKEYLIGSLSTDAVLSSASTTSIANKGSSSGSTWRNIIFSPTWSNFIIPTTIGIVVFVLYKGVFRIFT
uniref:Cytochrome b5 heme-binding domain-containing protein n=1 Tax=Angiostrongylus cantonensis TaxID=6313 RepID=A0A0K0D9Y2_ANGCA